VRCSECGRCGLFVGVVQEAVGPGVGGACGVVRHGVFFRLQEMCEGKGEGRVEGGWEVIFLSMMLVIVVVIVRCVCVERGRFFSSLLLDNVSVRGLHV